MRTTWNIDRTGGRRQWPATAYIVAALIASFLLAWFFSGSIPNPVLANLAYTSDLSKPWTLLTYPFAILTPGVFWFAISCWILYQFMSDIERRLGPYGITIFFFAMTFLGGLGYFIGSVIAAGPSSIVPRLDLPLEVVIFTWALLNWKATIKLFMFIPVPASVIAYLCIAAVVIQHGLSSPLVGVFTALPILVSWLYVTNRISFMRFGQVPDLAGIKQAKKETKEFDTYMDNVKKREQDRKEKEKLRKMLESSLQDDDEDEG